MLRRSINRTDAQVTEGDQNSSKSSKDTKSGRTTPLPSSNTLSTRRRDEYANLPGGWEARVDTDGRIFLIDHNNRETTNLDPRTEGMYYAITLLLVVK